MLTFKTYNRGHETETNRMEDKQNKILNKKILSNGIKKIICIYEKTNLSQLGLNH